MKRLAAVLLSLFALPILTSCAPVETGPTFTDEDRAAIQATTEESVAIANTSQDWDAYVEVYYAPDAVVLPPNAARLEGREAMAAFLASFPPMNVMEFEMMSMEGSGDMAYVVGRYHLEMEGPDGPTMDDGKYIEIWKRQADGGWKIAYDIFNSDLPLPGAEG
jgi:ketosteroid isomerase-like protein